MKISVKVHGGTITSIFSEATIKREMSKLLSQHAIVCNGCGKQNNCHNYHIEDDNITNGIHVEGYGEYPFACTEYVCPTEEMEMAKYGQTASLAGPAAEYVKSLNK